MVRVFIPLSLFLVPISCLLSRSVLTPRIVLVLFRPCSIAPNDTNYFLRLMIFTVISLWTPEQTPRIFNVPFLACDNWRFNLPRHAVNTWKPERIETPSKKICCCCNTSQYQPTRITEFQHFLRLNLYSLTPRFLPCLFACGKLLNAAQRRRRKPWTVNERRNAEKPENKKLQYRKCIQAFFHFKLSEYFLPS